MATEVHTGTTGPRSQSRGGVVCTSVCVFYCCGLFKGWKSEEEHGWAPKRPFRDGDTTSEYSKPSQNGGRESMEGEVKGETGYQIFHRVRRSSVLCV